MVKVLHPGFYSTIQDFGRIGFQQYGVPYSGVMDKHSTSIANAILGNIKDAAVIEMTMIGATLQFDCDTNICVSGADMSPMLNSYKINLNKCVSVKSGDILSFGKLDKGFRCYLAVSGGFQSEMVMQSQSMYKGITKDFKLNKNDELFIQNFFSKENKHASVRINNQHLFSDTIEVFKGPEFDALSKKQQHQLFSKTFTISKENNRMAYQLEQSIENNLEPIITSPVMPGTVQLTPSGKLIILMCDCQTTGGYPRILQLKETSMDVLAQKFTNQNMVFNLIDY